MQRNLSKRTSAILLLIVMILNPVMGVASSVFFKDSGSVLNHHKADQLEIQSEMSESCHDHADNALETSFNEKKQSHSDCCDDTCMCGQGSCHSPVTMLGDIRTSYRLNPTYDVFNAKTYLNPTLRTQTPPPII